METSATVPKEITMAQTAEMSYTRGTTPGSNKFTPDSGGERWVSFDEFGTKQGTRHVPFGCCADSPSSFTHLKVRSRAEGTKVAKSRTSVAMLCSKI